jgi:hypothetical protein
MSNGCKLAVITNVEKCLHTVRSGHGLTGGMERHTTGMNRDWQVKAEAVTNFV